MRRRILCNISQIHVAWTTQDESHFYKQHNKKSSTHLFLFWLLIEIFLNTFVAYIKHYFFILLILLLGHTIIGVHHIRTFLTFIDTGIVNKVIDECLFLLECFIWRTRQRRRWYMNGVCLLFLYILKDDHEEMIVFSTISSAFDTHNH